MAESGSPLAASEQLPLTDVGEQSIATLEALLERAQQKFSAEQVDFIQRAYTHAELAHRGQTRQSGLPYITHPLAVALIVMDMNLDYKSVASALLHDVLEDTASTKPLLEDEFDAEIADIVDGLSKLEHIEFQSKEQAQAENLRKMLLAMVSDIRVILIKLADRLHNMRTLDALSPIKKRRIARETLDVYAPIAHRLGIYRVKTELEELGFRAMHPTRLKILDSVIATSHKNRSHALRQLIERLEARLDEMGITATVTGREKSPYSLYRKRREKRVHFRHIYDLYALRIVVESVDECYRVLGVCHHLYAPLPKRFKDFIAAPKENGYQSLHTVCSNTDGIPIEVQIRSVEMDDYAESGMAAHWVYKEGEANHTQHHTRQWLSGIIELQDSSTDSSEFIEHVKVDLFPKEIYVFTPKRKVVQLPAGATPVDFAYAVHSQIGNTCLSAQIDGKLAPLSTELQSGQMVEINTSVTAKPNPMWLNFVVSAKARSTVRQYLRNLDAEQAAQFGERLINRALDRYELSLEAMPRKVLDSVKSDFHFESDSDLYTDVGLGNHWPSQIAERLVEKFNGTDEGLSSRPLRDTQPLIIEEEKGSVLTLARCCRPIPGDIVNGVITSGQGVVVHRAKCRNQKPLKRGLEWVAVDWAVETQGDYDSSIVVNLANRPGALARVCTVLSSMDSNIEGMNFDNRGQDDIEIQFLISVRNRDHLARLIKRVRKLSVVLKVTRET